VSLLLQVKELLPSAVTHTPYGMTEALPVSTLDPTRLLPADDAGQHGVCVGPPVHGVDVAVAPLDGAGLPSDTVVTTPGTLGEIVVRGPHVKDRYDKQWARQEASDRPHGWHRTGDVGHLDAGGRLWVEGRLAHLVVTAEGPVTPYAVEERARAVPGVVDAAVVGVGPRGTEQVVVVVVPERRLGPVARATGAPLGRRRLAPEAVAREVRAVAGVPVAAVLVRDWLPVDVRHASKVDRTALARWASAVLHGRGPLERARDLAAPGAPRRRSR
jgi:acyl-CoA synthetase (AMP-forming)/AMP-acid ligase II